MGILSNNDEDRNQDMVANFYFPTSKKALIIFTKNPELGRCKTRLASTIGNEAALEIYKYLLQQTATVSKEIIVDKYVFYSESIQINDVWDDRIFRKKTQHGKNLGVKMENAFLDIFQMGYQKVVIIGSDLLDLKPHHITLAFENLNNHEVVIGPAEDGGYYLLGLTNMKDFLFKNKPWSSEYLLDETLKDLKANNVPFATLETLNDIDTFEDLTTSKSYQSNLELQLKIKQIHD